MIEIKFNENMKRWEVFTYNSVVRNGELQPVFVSADLMVACAYVRRCGL